MVDKKCTFSLALYREILTDALQLGFEFQTFSQYLQAPVKKTVLLRHDVDVNLEWALRMARVERELDIRSTYFVRIHSTRYNLFDRHNYRYLHELKQMGFEIGVHQEVSSFAANSADAILLLKREKTVIETILGCAVNGVATHIPKSNILRLTPEVIKEAGFVYSPGAEIFNRNAIFVSDSNNHWKPYTFTEAIRKCEKVLANVHPVWWVGNISDTSALIQFLKDGN